jgi:hypothetical protein
MTQIIKTTENGKSYWEKSGAYTKEMDKLYDELVPAEGAAATLTGEIVRAANRLYYEFCNNGNCNACEIHEGDEIEVTCPCCHGEGYLDDEQEEICGECDGMGVIYEEGDSEIEIADFYSNFIDLIETTLSEAGDKEIETICSNIRGIIESMPIYSGSLRYTDDKNMHQYDILIDHVAAYAIEHRGENDSEIPESYGNKN